MTSVNDTNIIGSTVKGDRVVASVGGNLYIQSLQDKETYVGKQKHTGFSVSTNGTQLGSISGEHSKGDMRSNYASVTEQAGIFAGKDGYTITTKGTTTLEGAVIDSKAAAGKNTVSTGRLAMKDIENTAEYSSKNTGVSYNHIGNFKSLSQAGQDAVYNSLGLLPKLLPESKDSAHSTTKSAISDGTITVHDESVDIRSISRDTANSLNKLDKIFDKKKVEERQELARLFAKDAFEQLHYWEPKTKEEKVAKAIAHGVVAEVSARVAGNKPGSGFYAGVTNEALIGEIQKVAKTNPAVAQWLSAGVGAVVNAGLGKPVITGAAEAQYGTKWNGYDTTTILTGGLILSYANAAYQLNRINRFLATGAWIITTPRTGDINKDNIIYEYKGSNKYLKTDTIEYNATVNDIGVISQERVLLQKGPMVLNGRQYEWDYENQEYYPTEIYHIGENVYKNNGGKDILSREYWDGIGYTNNRYTGAVYGPDGTSNWFIEESSLPSSTYVKVRNSINGKIGEMSYSYGDKYLVDHPESNIILNPNMHQFIVDKTLQPVSKSFVLANKNRISSITDIDGNNVTADGWIDDFTYNPDFSKPKVLSSPVAESRTPNILTFPTNENKKIQILSSPIGQDIKVGKIGGFDLIPVKLNDYIYTVNEHPIWKLKVPSDAQTILSHPSFSRTNKIEPHGARVYMKDKKYYYRDTFHGGLGAHLEVFDKKGNHLGEADPLTGEIKEGTQDPDKTLKKEFR